MKKYLLLTLALIFTMAFFAACACDEPDDPTPPVIVETPDPTPEPEVDEPDEPEVPEIEPIPVPPAVLWSLSTDMYIQALEVGARNDEVYDASPVVTDAGDPGLVIEEGPAGNAITVRNRENNWYAIDVVTGEIDWDFANNTYIVVVHGVLSEAANFIIGGGDSPWEWLASGAFEGGAVDYAGNNFTVALILESEDCLLAAGVGEDDRTHLRLNTDCLVDFTINDIIISLHTSSAWPREDNVLYSLSTDPNVQLLNVGDFQTHGYDMVLATPNLTAAGDPRLDIVEGPYGNALSVRNRENSWYGIDVVTDLLPLDFDANSYTITVRGTVENPRGEFIVQGADSPWEWLATEYIDEEDGSFEVSLVLASREDLEVAGNRQWIRMVPQFLETYTIYDIVITRN